MTATQSVFDDAQADSLLDADAEHWWFREKGSIVNALLARHAPSGRVVDLGAGAGGVSARLASTRGPVVAVEGAAPLAASCARRGLAVAQGHTDRVPFQGRSAAAVTLLDVIEHLTDPIATLREARRILQGDGVVVVTVPAHTWLWSDADEFLGHVKRYSRRVLRDELDAAGFDVISCTHAFSWLVPPVALRRRLRRGGEPQLGLDADSGTIRAAARILGRAERAVTRLGPLPIGTSVVAVGRPRQTKAT